MTNKTRKLAMAWSPYKLRGTLAASFLLLFAGVHPAVAQRLALQQPVVSVAPRFSVRPIPSGAAFAAASALYLIPEAFKNSLPHGTCTPLPCDPATLPGIDRGIPGPVRNGPDLASDATLLATVGGSGLLVITRPGSLASREEDAVVWSQAVMTSSALLAWSTVLFHRPRPILYTGAAAANATPDNGLSFPSGHATLAFAAIAAYASIAHRRGGDPAGRKVATWAMVGTAAGTALLRVVARRHFPTDVMAGAILGTASGWLVPAVYPMH